MTALGIVISFMVFLLGLAIGANVGWHIALNTVDSVRKGRPSR